MNAKRNLVAALVAVTLALTVTPNAVGDARSDQQRKRDAAAAAREKASSQVEGVSAELGKLFVKQKEVEAELGVAKDQLGEAQTLLAEKERDAKQVKDRLAATEEKSRNVEAEIASSKAVRSQADESLGTIARQAYRGELVPSTLELALESKSSDDFLARASAAEAVSAAQNRTLNDVEDSIARSDNEQEKLGALKSRIGELKVEADNAVAAANKARTDRENKVKDLDKLTSDNDKAKAELEKRKADFAEAERKADADYQAAQAEIARIDAANRKSRKPAAPNPGGGGGGGSPAPGKLFSPPIRTPLQVTSPFGYRIHPILGRRKLHAGVDLRSACGQAQYATAPGVVISTRYEGSGGNTVTINHGFIGGASWITKHRHLSSFSVSSGQTVGRNTVIGTTGATGGVTGCHVHYETIKNGEPVNPMGLF